MSEAADVARPVAAEVAPDKVAIASQWQLTWWAFRKHKLAMVGLWVIALFYLIAAFAEVLAPADPTQQNRRAVFHPPQAIHFIDHADDGLAYPPLRLRDGPRSATRPRWRSPIPVPARRSTCGSSASGEAYWFWGPGSAATSTSSPPVNPRDQVFLFGADRLGRDMFSRVMYGTRISMSIGLVGVADQPDPGRSPWAASRAITAAGSMRWSSG